MSPSPPYTPPESIASSDGTESNSLIPIQDLGGRVLVHWDRGVDISSAGPHIMSVLRKIWGAERQLQTKKDTLAQRRKSLQANQVLIDQSLNEKAKWEEILRKYELELDGWVFKRYQLKRVVEQAGQHVPQGKARVYVKYQGYTLPKTAMTPKRERKESQVPLTPISVAAANDIEHIEDCKEVTRLQDDARRLEGLTGSEILSQRAIEDNTNNHSNCSTCVICLAIEILETGGEESKIKLGCGHEYCLSCLYKLWQNDLEILPPGCCDFNNFDLLLKFPGFSLFENFGA
ncbi:hypothetical protein BDZ91DRAFT_112402 [Kalaharituber pfeilii]|nr:hypothetical protein BDZ91DRAFT_112402 [Kalaharituber pfeilii]